MTEREFNHFLHSLGALSPEQLAALRRALDSKLAASPVAASESVFDVADRAGLVGCVRECRAARPT
jgi:hypothetical protein